MTCTVRIRLAERDDYPAIAEVQAESWKDAYRGTLPATYLAGDVYEDLARHWQGVVTGPGDVVMVAADKGGVIGFIAVWCRPDPFIDNLHVLPALRSKGIGRKLMAAAVARLVQDGHNTAYLWVLETNDRAIRLYEELGGVAADRTIKSIFGHDLPALRFVWDDIAKMIESPDSV